MTTAVDSPLKWHGGKSYLCARLHALKPVGFIHQVETHFGGGSFTLAGDGEGISEVANDKNVSLTNFWSVLKSPMLLDEFKQRLECTPFSQIEWEQSKNTTCGTIDEAVSFFVRCRQSMSGRMKSFAPLSRTRTRRGMNEQASAWMNAVDGLPEVHARLRRIVILNQDAIEVIKSQDGPGTFFYCDPPYLHETRATTGEYEHEMSGRAHAMLLTKLCGKSCISKSEFNEFSGEETYEELLSLATPLQGKFMLSGYESGLYQRYENSCGLQIRQFDLPNNSASGATKQRRKEVVWMNYEPPARVA